MAGRPTAKEADEHEEIAYQLHLRGKSERDIAREMGLSQPGVHKILQRAFRQRTPLSPDEDRAVDDTRYGGLLDRLYTMLDSSKDPLFVIDRILKVLAQRAVLLGLNKPVVVGDDLGDELASLIKRIASRYQETSEEHSDADAAAQDA